MTPGWTLEVDPGRDRGRPQLLDRVVDEHRDRHRRTARRFLRLDQAEVEQVVDDAREPVGLATTRSASGRATAGSSVAAIVSASSPSAPIGVLSSWLTLATKSRRTLSTRRASETSRDERDHAHGSLGVADGHGRSCSTCPGRAEELQLALAGLTQRARARSSASSAPATTASACRAARKRSRGRVADHLDAVGIDHHHGLSQLVEHGPEAVVLHGGGLGLPEGRGQRLFQRGVRGVAPLGAHELIRTDR